LCRSTLEWSAAHTDEGFWRENACKLTDNNCQLLRVLIKAGLYSC
jgi:V-type H+-transporting ATPase subunit H